MQIWVVAFSNRSTSRYSQDQDQSVSYSREFHIPGHVEIQGMFTDCILINGGINLNCYSIDVEHSGSTDK
uniref:Uncharacterized protein n=1 Tax=Anguilla anguilla TaxID=7936 RepID=A0A0E9PUI5_ANGAN